MLFELCFSESHIETMGSGNTLSALHVQTILSTSTMWVIFGPVPVSEDDSVLFCLLKQHSPNTLRSRDLQMSCENVETRQWNVPKWLIKSESKKTLWTCQLCCYIVEHNHLINSLLCRIFCDVSLNKTWKNICFWNHWMNHKLFTDIQL